MRTSMEADAAQSKAAASCSTRGASAHLTAVDLRGQMKTPPRSLDNGTPPVPRESTQEPPITTTGLALLNGWGAGGVDLGDASLPKSPSVRWQPVCRRRLVGEHKEWTSKEMPKSRTPDYWDTTTSPTCPAPSHPEEEHPGLPWGACRGLLRVAETQKKTIQASRGGRAEDF